MLRFPNCGIYGRRDAAFRLKAILASQPFRERPGTDSNLCASEHRTQESDFGHKIPFRMSSCLALYDDLAFVGPEKSPLWGKVLHLKQIEWTKIVTALAHSCLGIFADGFHRVLQEIRATQLAFNEDRTRSGGPADYVLVLVRWCGKLVQHHRALSAQPADTYRN